MAEDRQHGEHRAEAEAGDTMDVHLARCVAMRAELHTRYLASVAVCGFDPSAVSCCVPVGVV